MIPPGTSTDPLGGPLERPAGLASGGNRWLPLAVALLCLLPLLCTPVLPSVDFYAHIVRYNVLSHPAADAQNYRPHWVLLPNLGMDVLGTGLMALLPPLAGARVLAALVILAPVLGCMALSRALHGRVQPLPALLAGVLGYNLILFWGFANFLLGFGLALAQVGWWIACRDRPRLQLLSSIPLGIVILFIHGLVFALWGLMLAMVELGMVLQAAPPGARRPGPLLRKLLLRGLRLLLLAVIPVLLFLQMRTAEGPGGTTGALQNLAQIAGQDGGPALARRLLEELAKRIDSVLRVAEASTTPLLDRLFGLALWGGLLWGWRRGQLRLDARLWPVTLLMVLLVGLMPPNLFGVGHLDERIPLVLLALVIAGLVVRPGPEGWRRGPLALLAVMLPLHLVMAAWGMVQAGGFYRDYMQQTRDLPTGPLAVAHFDGATGGRDGGRRCKPLLFLLQLEEGTAVPTFANPTQQPLRLAGPLAAAGRQSPGRNAPLDRAVPAYFDAGYNTVVACLAGPGPAPSLPGSTIAAQGPGWALYQPAPTGAPAPAGPSGG